jgi:hypothetical protein
MNRIGIALFLAGACLSGTLNAHHSTQGIYQDEISELTGTVKQWRLINPHPNLTVEVKDENGVVQVWDVSYGGAAAVHLKRMGYASDTFKEGETITFKGHRARAEGVNGLLVEGGGNVPTRADGTPVVKGGSMF